MSEQPLIAIFLSTRENLLLNLINIQIYAKHIYQLPVDMSFTDEVLKISLIHVRIVLSQDSLRAVDLSDFENFLIGYYCS